MDENKGGIVTESINYLPIWVAIFLPLLVLFINNQQANQTRRIKRIKKRKKEGIMMNNELVSGYVGKFVNIFSTGGSGFGANGTIIKVVDNWLEFEVKGKKKLINIDYITSIEELPQKK